LGESALMSSPWQAVLQGVSCAAGLHTGEWHSSAASCIETRACTRCNRTEEREHHDWSAWSYDETQACAVRSCARCRKRESPFPELVPPQLAARQAVAAKAPAQAAKAPADTINDLTATLLRDDVPAIRAYLAASPPTAQRDEVLPFLDQPGELFHLSALNLYCVSIAESPHADRALELATAVQTAGCVLYEQRKDAEFLGVTAWATFQTARALGTLGRDEELVRRIGEMLDWLLARGATTNICELQLAMAEAHLALGQFQAAGERLAAAEAIPLAPGDMGTGARRAAVRATYNKVAARDARELNTAEVPSSAPSVEDQIDWMLKNLHALPPEQARAFEPLLTALRAEGTDKPESWLGKSDSAMEQLAGLLGADAPGTRANIQRRIRSAAGVVTKEVEGRDPAVLTPLVQELRSIVESARSSQWENEQATAQWLLQTCYRRLQRFPEALNELEEIRDGLEQQRSAIADPMKRAGVFAQFSQLFPVLVEVNYKLGDTTGVLDAIEGGKARMLRDLLLANNAERAEAAELRESVAPALVASLADVRAHYLTFLMDEDCTWAALVTSDGTELAERIELDRVTIRRYAEIVDPSKWGRRSGGLMGRKTPDDLPDRLAPLVAWLEEFWDEGLIKEGDHISYSPDEELHLVPLHLLTFRGRPLLQSLSVSRVHSARALVGLLSHPPLRAARFTAVQASAQEDAPEIAPDFGAVTRWLLQTMPGSAVAGEDATLERVRSLDCRKRLVHFTTHGMFPAPGNTLLDPNPFRSSGMLLAAPSGLPSKNAAAHGQASDCLLTPAGILALDFSGSHVTLQACSSGLSREGAGGDALGMEYAFLLAGAPSVLAAHWDVPLGPSSEFCTMFYKNWLAQRMSRAEAWRSVALDMCASTGSPHTWAAFSLTGDWR
jgi:hypothetical protein